MPALVTPDRSFAVEEAFGDSQPKSGLVLGKMSETSDELCLKWDGFQENTSKAFVNSHKNVDFADVTLACEDGPTIKAHKIILSSSGPFFKNILRKTDHPHPMIYMRNVKSSDLEALLDFIYLGEAKVDKENLEGFLALGQEFELPGLTIALCHKGCHFSRGCLLRAKQVPKFSFL